MGRGKEIAHRLVKQLRRDLKGIGWGAKKRALEAAGVSRAYLENVKPDRIPLGTYFDMLDGVGIDARRHAERALSDREPIADFLADARAIESRSGTPRIVRLARKNRLDSKVDCYSFDLAELDRIRFRDPRVAAQRVESLVELAQTPRDMAYFLCTWALAQRVWGHYDDARVALSSAIEFSLNGEDGLVVGEVLTRTAIILREQSEESWSESLGRSSASRFFAANDLERFGRALASLTCLLRNVGRHDEAEALANIALATSSSLRTRGCAQVALSDIQLNAGRTKEAGQYAALASDMLSRQPDLVGYSYLLRGRIAMRTREFHVASQHFGRALASSRERPSEALHAGVHLIDALLARGDSRTGKRAAKELSLLLADFGNDAQGISRKVRTLAHAAETGDFRREDLADFCDECGH